MTNPFVCDPRTRLLEWKNVRLQIAQLTDPLAQIQCCLNFWKQAGIENYYLDWDNCEQWPGAWDLLWQNHFCPSGLSLGVAYTLVISDPRIFDNICLNLILDRTASIHKIVVDWNNWYINAYYLDCLDKTHLPTSLSLNKWIYKNKSWQKI